MPTPLFQSGTLTAPSTFSFAMLAAGVYHYHSTLGEQPAMRGTIKGPVSASLDG